MASWTPTDAEIAELQRLGELTDNAKVKEYLLAPTAAPKAPPTLAPAAAAAALASPAPAPAAAAPAAAASAAPKPVKPAEPSAEKLSKYAWEQTASQVKIYVTLPGVENVAASDIQPDFQPETLRLRINNLAGRNYLLHIDLAEKINPSECSFKVRSGRVTVVLKKKSDTTWAYITKAEKSKADQRAPKVKDNDDPGASIMTMMKDMYESGDDEMKKMIGKAWTESRDKKNTGDL